MKGGPTPAMQAFIHNPKSLFWLALSISTISCLALLVHIWYTPEKLIWMDGQEYYSLAVNLLDYGVYARDAGNLSHLEQVRPPFYPALIALPLSLWRDPRSIALFQLALCLALLAGCYFFFVRIEMPWTGSITALILALSPTWWLHAVTTNPEVVFAVLWACSAACEFQALRRNKLALAAIAGLLLGFGVLTKPFLLPFLPLAAMVPLTFRRIALSRRITHSTLVLILALLTIFPWILRNHSNFGTWQVSSISGFNLLFHNAAIAEARATGRTEPDVSADYWTELTPSLRTNFKTDFANTDLLVSRANQILRQYWKEALNASLTGIVVNSIAPPVGLTRDLLPGLQLSAPEGTGGRQGGMSFIGRVVSALSQAGSGTLSWQLALVLGEALILGVWLWPFSLYGIWRLWKHGTPGTGFYLIMVVLYFWLCNNMVTNPRFRVMIMPFLAFAAAYGTLYVLWRIRGAKGEPPESLEQAQTTLDKENDRK